MRHTKEDYKMNSRKYREFLDGLAPEVVLQEKTCSYCGGSGYDWDGGQCPECGGLGTV